MGQATEGDQTRVRALVLRSSCDETTFSIVTARKTQQVWCARQMVHAFCDAVTAWVQNTPEGRKAYEESDSDYNVGDLANDIDDRALAPYLAAQGLRDVEIEVVSDEDFQNNWTFDTHLIDPSRLNQ